MSLVRNVLVVLLLVILTSFASSQDRTAVFEFKGIGLDDNSIMAASQIFRNELQATGKFTVVGKEEIDGKMTEMGKTTLSCFEISCAADIGYALNARYAVIGSLSKLGEKIIIDAQLVSVVDKTVQFSDKFTATSMDDMEMALRKVAGALASRKKIESEVGRFTITEEEAMEPRRKKSYITSGAMFGFGFPLGDSYSKVNSLFNLSWVMRYEAGQYVLENLAGLTWGSGDPDTVYNIIIDKTHVSIFHWDIGMRYVFSRGQDFSPFVGGGLGMHFIGAQSADGDEYAEGDQAFALHLAGGLYAFQSYDFRFTVEAKYTIVFSDAFAGDESSSQQIGIYLGITRKLEKGEKRGCMGGGGGCF